jgi:hypothetical protein
MNHEQQNQVMRFLLALWAQPRKVWVVSVSGGSRGNWTTSRFASLPLGTGGAISAPPDLFIRFFQQWSLAVALNRDEQLLRPVWDFLPRIRLVVRKIFRKGGAKPGPAIHTAAVLPAEDEVCRDVCRGIATFSDSF